MSKSKLLIMLLAAVVFMLGNAAVRYSNALLGSNRPGTPYTQQLQARHGGPGAVFH